MVAENWLIAIVIIEFIGICVSIILKNIRAIDKSVKADRAITTKDLSNSVTVLNQVIKRVFGVSKDSPLYDDFRMQGNCYRVLLAYAKEKTVLLQDLGFDTTPMWAEISAIDSVYQTISDESPLTPAKKAL
jgi:hypothetical protein